MNRIISNRDELIALLREGKIEEFNQCRSNVPPEIWGMGFTEPDLSGVDLHGLDLAGVDFTSANLSDANLSESKFVQAKFGHAKLHRTNFENADLRQAKFDLARFDGTLFAGANFWGAEDLADSVRQTFLKHLQDSWGTQVKARKVSNCMLVLDRVK